MAVDPFSRRRLTPDEWRARARIIESQLDGLTIAELLRGGRAEAAKHGESAGSDPGEYDPKQPRVPAGHPDGGQWTNKAKAGADVGINDPRIVSDVTPDNDWIPGADYAAVGHHWMAREFYRKFPFSRETRKVFRDATSGPLPHRVYSEDKRSHFQHLFDKPHREYNAALYELITKYMNERGITPQQMTPDQAREFLKTVHESNDLRIRRYNEMIKFMNRMYRLRSGGRGSE